MLKAEGAGVGWLKDQVVVVVGWRGCIEAKAVWLLDIVSGVGVVEGLSAAKEEWV